MEFLLNLLLIRGREAIGKWLELKRKIMVQYSKITDIKGPENMLGFINYSASHYKGEGENLTVTGESCNDLRESSNNTNAEKLVGNVKEERMSTIEIIEKKIEELLGCRTVSLTENSQLGDHVKNQKIYHEDNVVDNLEAILKSQEFLLKNVIKLVGILEKDKILTKNNKKLDKVKKKLTHCKNILSNKGYSQDLSSLINDIIDDEVTRCRFRHGESKTSAQINLKASSPNGLEVALEQKTRKVTKSNPVKKKRSNMTIPKSSHQLSGRRSESSNISVVIEQHKDGLRQLPIRSKSDSEIYESRKAAAGIIKVQLDQLRPEIENSKKLLQVSHEHFQHFENRLWHSLTTSKYYSLKEEHLNICKSTFHNKRQFRATETAIAKKIKLENDIENFQNVININKTIFETVEKKLLFASMKEELCRTPTIRPSIEQAVNTSLKLKIENLQNMCVKGDVKKDESARKDKENNKILKKGNPPCVEKAEKTSFLMGDFNAPATINKETHTKSKNAKWQGVKEVKEQKDKKVKEDKIVNLKSGSVTSTNKVAERKEIENNNSKLNNRRQTASEPNFLFRKVQNVSSVNRIKNGGKEDSCERVNREEKPIIPESELPFRSTPNRVTTDLKAKKSNLNKAEKFITPKPNLEFKERSAEVTVKPVKSANVETIIKESSNVEQNYAPRENFGKFESDTGHIKINSSKQDPDSDPKSQNVKNALDRESQKFDKIKDNKNLIRKTESLGEKKDSEQNKTVPSTITTEKHGVKSPHHSDSNKANQDSSNSAKYDSGNTSPKLKLRITLVRPQDSIKPDNKSPLNNNAPQKKQSLWKGRIEKPVRPVVRINNDSPKVAPTTASTKYETANSTQNECAKAKGSTEQEKNKIAAEMAVNEDAFKKLEATIQSVHFITKTPSKTAPKTNTERIDDSGKKKMSTTGNINKEGIMRRVMSNRNRLVENKLYLNKKTQTLTSKKTFLKPSCSLDFQKHCPVPSENDKDEKDIFFIAQINEVTSPKLVPQEANLNMRRTTKNAMQRQRVRSAPKAPVIPKFHGNQRKRKTNLEITELNTMVDNRLASKSNLKVNSLGKPTSNVHSKEVRCGKRESDEEADLS